MGRSTKLLRGNPMGYLDSRGLAYFWEKVKAYADDRPYLVKAPVGTIVVWSGTVEDIPTGWALCDGTNGTPDLRGRFVLGTGGTYNPGDTGGSEEVTMTVAQLPAHKFSYSYKANGTSNVLSSNGGSYNLMKQNTEGSTTTAKYTNSLGNSAPHPNMPPYCVLCYIIKVAPDPALDGVTMEQVNAAIQSAVLNSWGGAY